MDIPQNSPAYFALNRWRAPAVPALLRMLGTPGDDGVKAGLALTAFNN